MVVFFQDSLEKIVLTAKQDKQAAEKLILQFKPFIASVIQKRIGKYLEFGVDDELSIGLIAFNEAIHSYNQNKGKFLSFARLVIINRLIDYYRKQSKVKTVPLSDNENGNGDDLVIDYIDKKAVEQFAYKSEEEDRKFEIVEYTRVLKDWGIKFADLIRVSPRQENLRNEYNRIARRIIADEKLFEDLCKTKRLPIKQLEKLFPIHRKKIERGRIYIIALVIAMKNKLSFLES